MKFPFDLAENKEFDAVGFGTNAVDYLIQVPEYPPFNSKIELTDYIQAAGGEAATTMVGLQRLNLKTCYVGRFGTDGEGDFGLQTLRDEAVDVSFAEQIKGARTQIAFIVIDQRNGERTVIWHRDKLLSYDATEAPVEAAALGKVLHFTPHDTRACLLMARAAKAEKTIVSIDVDRVFGGIGELLPQVDILISSAEFPEKLKKAPSTMPVRAELNFAPRFFCLKYNFDSPLPKKRRKHIRRNNKEQKTVWRVRPNQTQRTNAIKQADARMYRAKQQGKCSGKKENASYLPPPTVPSEASKGIH